MPSARHSSAIARCRTRCGRRCGRRSPPAAGAGRPPPRSRRTTGRGPRGCSPRTRTAAPACSAASGVAMNVFDGQSTVSPRTPANSSAASAAPVQPENATAASPFQAAQAASKRSVSGPSDPALGGDHLVPQRVQPRAVALVEADREALEVGRRSLAGGAQPLVEQRPPADQAGGRGASRRRAARGSPWCPSLIESTGPATARRRARRQPTAPIHSAARSGRAAGSSQANPPASTSGSISSSASTNVP